MKVLCFSNLLKGFYRAILIYEEGQPIPKPGDEIEYNETKYIVNFSELQKDSIIILDLQDIE